MKKTLSLSLIAALLALSSCSMPYVDIGGAIKYSTEYYTVADYGKPSNAQAYQCSNGDYYMQVPLVSYTRSWPMIYWYPSFELGNRISSVQATGEYQWICLTKDKGKGQTHTLADGKESEQYEDFHIISLTGQPELTHTKKVENPIPSYVLYDTITMRAQNTAQQNPSTVLKIVAAPFDYAIDPSLTIAANIALVPTALVVATIINPIVYLFSEKE